MVLTDTYTTTKGEDRQPVTSFERRRDRDDGGDDFTTISGGDERAAGGNGGSRVHVGEWLPTRFGAREMAAEVVLVLAEQMEVTA
uniref:DUF834 domain-containing protein n=1 Tax=Oryza sativa subsp. japonica TaxID=39947 RepID=Q69KT0_ORYSJ|nr:hypothetical protein [Oryza sativa Japonica Group]BAD36479.1 hypothetical protein [Oryza sativa Japonica Group]